MRRIHEAKAGYYAAKSAKHARLAGSPRSRFGTGDEDADVRVPDAFKCALTSAMLAVPLVVYTTKDGKIVASTFERGVAVPFDADKLGLQGHALLGARVDVQLAIQIRAWVTHLGAAMAAYDEQVVPRWVHLMRAAVDAYERACAEVPAPDVLKSAELMHKTLDANAQAIANYGPTKKPESTFAIKDQTIQTERGAVTLVEPPRAPVPAVSDLYTVTPAFGPTNRRR